MFTSSMCSIPVATFHVDAPILFCMGCSLFSGYRIEHQCLYQNHDCSFRILSTNLQMSMLKVASNIDVYILLI